MVLSSLGNLERTQFATIPNVRFSDWTPIVAGSNVEKAETLVCRNKLAPGVRPLEDLTAYGRQRAAAAKPPAQTAATPSPAAQRPPGSKDVYVAGMVSKQIVVLIDKSSFKRQGDILTYSRLDIYPTPERFHGAVIYWDEATMQTDCKMFRSHMRVDAYLNEDRSVRTPEAKAQFIPWENDQKDSFARYLDEFVCEGKHASDFKPIDLDVDTYRKAILEAIKQGVIKD